MVLRIAVNGAGRIGRNVIRQLLTQPHLKLIAINDLADTATITNLLENDSTHGTHPCNWQHQNNTIKVANQTIAHTQEPNPEKLPWQKQNIDIVIEATGRFTNKKDAEKHIQAGAKHVIISAPTKDDDIPTIVMGVNQDKINWELGSIMSNASCTTNALAPIIQAFKGLPIDTAYMTTIHAATNDQNIQDTPHKDPRRARTIFNNIIPTTTGAAKTVGKVIPELNGKIDGISIRVPTQNVSLIDLTINLGYAVPQYVIRRCLTKYQQQYPHILNIDTKPKVSIDYNGDQHSTTIDDTSIMTHHKTLKLLAWYDNETAYATRIIDLIKTHPQHL